MGLSRYLAKLAALVGSDGKVQGTGIQDGLGFGNTKVLAGGSNLNTVTARGVYAIPGATNSPNTTDWVHVEVMGNGTDQIQQRLRVAVYINGAEYLRESTNGGTTWSAWVQVGGNYTPVSEIKLSTYGDVKRFNSALGHKWELGFLSNGSNANNYAYIHVKTSVIKNNVMSRFRYEGFGYSQNIIESMMVVYSYTGQATPYDPTYFRGGNNSAYGFVNCYYSTDGCLVLVIQFNANPYTGGWLSCVAGGSHYTTDVNVLAYTHSNSLSGVY